MDEGNSIALYGKSQCSVSWYSSLVRLRSTRLRGTTRLTVPGAVACSSSVSLDVLSFIRRKLTIDRAITERITGVHARHPKSYCHEPQSDAERADENDTAWTESAFATFVEVDAGEDQDDGRYGAEKEYPATIIISAYDCYNPKTLRS